MSVTPFHTRDDWGARPPKRPAGNIDSEGLTAHYGGDSPWGSSADRSSAARFLATTDHSRCATMLRGWQGWHMDNNGWADLAYNAAVCPHGHRYEGRGPGKRSGANGTNDGNARSCAVVYIAGGDDPLTDAAKLAFHDEAQRFRDPLWRNHSDWKSTSCAGPAIKHWQANGWPRPADPEGDPFPMLSNEQQQTLLRNSQNLADELLHFKEMTDPVPQTGQRKSQLYEALVNADKVPEILRRQVVVEAAVADQAETLQEILDAVKALVPAEPDKT